MHRAFQYIAILIHLAQFAFGIDFVPAVYQQVIHNQPAAGANAEPVFYDRRRYHKSPLIQALKGSIAYAFYQFNANLGSSGIYSHLPQLAEHLSPVAIAERKCKANAENKTADVQPAALVRAVPALCHRFDGRGEAALVARGLVLVDDFLVGDAVDDARRLA